MPQLIQKPTAALEKIKESSPLLRVLDFLLNHQDEDFTIKDIAEKADVGRTTLWDGLLRNLLNDGIIIKTRDIGNARMYKINENSIFVKHFINFKEELKNESETRE